MQSSEEKSFESKSMYNKNQDNQNYVLMSCENKQTLNTNESEDTEYVLESDEKFVEYECPRASRLPLAPTVTEQIDKGCPEMLFSDTDIAQGYQPILLDDGKIALWKIADETELNETVNKKVDLESPPSVTNDDKSTEAFNHIFINGKKYHQCPYKGCLQLFKASSHLKNHIYNHTGEKPFACSHCQKSFNRVSGLKLHTRTHTGERPYKCEFEACNKTFSCSGDRRKHHRIHTDERPYKCTQPGCDKSFKTWSIANHHLNTHTGNRNFTCNVCTKKFTNQSNLTHHMRIHNDEKPFQCAICLKHFREYSTVFKHMKSHVNVPPKSSIIFHELKPPAPKVEEEVDPDDPDDINNELIEYVGW